MLRLTSRGYFLCGYWDESDANHSDSNNDSDEEDDGDRDEENWGDPEGDTDSWDWDSDSEDGDSDSEGDANSEGGDSNSEGDYGSILQNTSNGPLKKKAKTHQSVAESPSKMENNVSLLATMPLDILFEIFTLLHPKDILSVSRTSKIFHENLTSQNMLGIWKAARERISAPDCPDWMPEDVWAALLFGHKCQSCGTRTTQYVDFLLLKRLCISCKKRHYVLRSKVEEQYPKFDFVILLVPSTDITSEARSGYYYWDFDIRSMVSQLAALKKDDDAQQLHRFMEERKRRLQCIGQNSSSWQHRYHLMQQDAEMRQFLQIKERFKELGYVEEDLLELRSLTQGRGTAPLSAKMWSRIRPMVEPKLKEQKARRLAKIKCTRRRVLAARYKEFQRTLQPSQWKYLPRTLEIAEFEAFSQHIEADAGVEVNATTFDDAFLEFPDLLASAAEQRKATLRVLVGDREEGEIGADPVDLATAVFQCCEDTYHSHFRYVFGWDEVASHHCRPENLDRPESWHRTTPLELKYSPEIADVVRKLAQLTGLNVGTATAADFDEKNKRFSCGACPSFKGQDRQHFQRGYTWQDLAAHLHMWKDHNPNLNIKVLSANAENEVKQRERKDRKWDAKKWTCSHCPEYLDNLQSQQSVVKHLSDSHGIQTPSEPVDYFLFEQCRRKWTVKPKFCVPAPPKKLVLAPQAASNKSQNHVSGKFRCLVCVSKTKQFLLDGVKSHLQAKHRISKSVGQIGVHYASA